MIVSDLQTALIPLLRHYDKDQICVIHDAAISLPNAPWAEGALGLSISEETKSLETVSHIWDVLFEKGITRRGVLVCIGGGVLTDTGGFAAATYKRGIDYINVPTTLLAMIDASSGGKTGINYNGLKNAIGVFAPPVETIIWPGWLKTLPAREVLSGFAEMLKTGLIDRCTDRAQKTDRLWNRLLRYDLDRMDITEITPLIEQCVKVKERIVAADPKEEGLRKVLNLGHTFGHALEEVQMINGKWGNGQLLHGFAVVYGMIAELYLSVVKLDCPKAPLQQLTQLMLQYYGKPQCKCSDRDKLITLMQQDKKNERAAEINCTLIQDIGSPVINQVITRDEANEALEYLFSL